MKHITVIEKRSQRVIADFEVSDFSDKSIVIHNDYDVLVSDVEITE